MGWILALIAGFLSYAWIEPHSFGMTLVWLFMGWPVMTLVVAIPFLFVAWLIGLSKR